MKITLPGAFWLALITFITLWLPALVPGAPWLPRVLLVLTAIGKAVQVAVEAQPSRALDLAPRSSFARWLWG